MNFGLREVIIFLVVLAMPVGAYFAIFKPQNEKIEDKKAQIVHKEQMLTLLREETSRNEDLQRANEEIAQRIEEIESRLPTGKEVDQIVRQVSEIAVASGLEAPTFKSSSPIAAARYFEQPLEMTTKGSFKGYYEFLASLERMPRITRIVDMKVVRAREDAEIEVDFTLSIYFRADEGSST
ncbi:MAG: type 4a pilus biogenesis protein PilO [Phycisphaerales bacterium JB059]